MENGILEQVYLFSIYLLSGIVIGILFDIFRIFRLTFKTSDFITYIEDILFWLLTGFFLIFILFTFSKGEIRLYSVVSLVLGITIYMLSISKYFIKINVKIVLFSKDIIYKIFSFIILPIKIIMKIFKRIFKSFTFFVINQIKKTKKIKKIVFKRRIFKSNVEK